MFCNPDVGVELNIMWASCYLQIHHNAMKIVYYYASPLFISSVPWNTNCPTEHINDRAQLYVGGIGWPHWDVVYFSPNLSDKFSENSVHFLWVTNYLHLHNTWIVCSWSQLPVWPIEKPYDYGGGGDVRSGIFLWGNLKGENLQYVGVDER